MGKSPLPPAPILTAIFLYFSLGLPSVSLSLSLSELSESLRVSGERQCRCAGISVLRCARSHVAALLSYTQSLNQKLRFLPHPT